MLTDLLITTKNRPELLRKSLSSLVECTRDYRLTVVQDGWDLGTTEVLDHFAHLIDVRIVHVENRGLGPSMNEGLASIKSTNDWFSDQNVPDKTQVSSFICYTQDDVLYTSGWLDKLTKMFLLLEKQHNIGFASGIESIEHPVHKNIGGGLVLKKWIRATQMLARRDYWYSMLPIPRFDPETQNIRARPHDGIGSGVDWWFIRNHPNSVARSGRNCLVIPGLCQHAGYKDSTWLKRELPESESDKAAVAQEKSTIPCDTYGCKRPKPISAVFCDSCAAEYREDPDAFK